MTRNLFYALEVDRIFYYTFSTRSAKKKKNIYLINSRISENNLEKHENSSKVNPPTVDTCI